MMGISDKYPKISAWFDEIKLTRRNEILTSMLGNDEEYKRLCNERADASMALRQSLETPALELLFEKYSDTIYAQEVYELDALYKQGFNDAVGILDENGLLK